MCYNTLNSFKEMMFTGINRLYEICFVSFLKKMGTRQQVHNIQVSLKNKSQQYTFDIFMAPPTTNAHTHTLHQMTLLKVTTESSAWLVFPGFCQESTFCSFPQRRGLVRDGGYYQLLLVLFKQCLTTKTPHGILC